MRIIYTCGSFILADTLIQGNFISIHLPEGKLKKVLI